MNPPQFSILIGTFGDAQWNRLSELRATPSALRQADEPADEEIRVQVLRHHDPNGTLHGVRNELARCATGDWLVFLDGDDELAPGYIAALARCVDYDGDRPRARLLTPAVLYTPDRPLSRRPRTLPNLRRARVWPKVDLADGNYLVIGTAMPRWLFHQAGGFKDWPLYEDWALFAACYRAGATVIEVPDAVYVAYAKTSSRNRAPARRERLYWHQAIGHDVFPESYAPTTASEDVRRALDGNELRRLVA